jgi:hypothetical protein
MAIAVRATHITSRKAQPLNNGSPLNPCAMPTVNGLKAAPANPTPAPMNGIATPVS